jgi:hypothetical protein
MASRAKSISKDDSETKTVSKSKINKKKKDDDNKVTEKFSWKLRLGVLVLFVIGLIAIFIFVRSYWGYYSGLEAEVDVYPNFINHPLTPNDATIFTSGEILNNKRKESDMASIAEMSLDIPPKKKRGCVYLNKLIRSGHYYFEFNVSKFSGNSSCLSVY